MPSLQKFHAQVARHNKSMMKNLCANLIRNEAIITTKSKAMKAQAKIEKFLHEALENERAFNAKEKPLDIKDRLAINKAFRYLQPPDKEEVGSKIINELSKRYPNRKTGFTRIIKLERRLGDDKAPMALIELVDSPIEFKFWYQAKVVARLELQNLPLDDLTSHNVKKLTKERENGEEEFRNAVETCKREFFKYDTESKEFLDPEIEEQIKNIPTNLEYYGGDLVGKVLVSKKHPTKPRFKKEIELPPSPFLADSK
ncbi:ribosomal protein L17 [Scheffersomyces amazonensis]|uniref:ribosomal protein L17 n=1 Tax=Scheffersomyces amazonensis TaxID=1078765 RepID=UPI00315C8C0B